ncbi:unnamed protein product [Lactuca virosa]|uniref:Uncharacterized protein n=1 Tax=Lactuca virosa TaxID=75947 RepID=A0AAU9PYD3_9ASTR|nr:unnamed protein product [Lactuca virosa]
MLLKHSSSIPFATLSMIPIPTNLSLMERSQLDRHTIDVDAPPTIDVDVDRDVDEGDDKEVANNKGGGHNVSWIWQHFGREGIKKGA